MSHRGGAKCRLSLPGGRSASLSLSFFGGQTETELQGWAMPGSLAASGEKVKKKSPETMTNLGEVFVSFVYM